MSSSMSRRQPAPGAAGRQRYGAHRGGGGIIGALMPSVLAVVAVAALITALAVWQGEDPDQPGAAGSTTQDSATTEVASPETAKSETSEPGASEPASTPAETTAAESTAAESTAAESTAAGETSAPSDLEVVVLNQTSRGGLAGSVADRLRSVGWEVFGVGDFTGIVPDTTVYYPDGAEAEARALARDLPTDPRVRPRFGNLSTSRLTVVVTDSYPG